MIESSVKVLSAMALSFSSGSSKESSSKIFSCSLVSVVSPESILDFVFKDVNESLAMLSRSSSDWFTASLFVFFTISIAALIAFSSSLSLLILFLKSIGLKTELKLSAIDSSTKRPTGFTIFKSSR